VIPSPVPSVKSAASNSVRPAASQSSVGGALAGQKKFQEAEPLLVEGYEGMKEREANIPPAAKTRLSEAIRRLVELYTAWDRQEEALKWKTILEESAEKT